MKIMNSIENLGIKSKIVAHSQLVFAYSMIVFEAGNTESNASQINIWKVSNKSNF